MIPTAPVRPRRWLVTGVSSGLGRALAEVVLARGDIVVGTVRLAEQAAAFEALAPGRSLAVLLDLTDEAAVARTVPEAVARAGGLDVLVNNAGYSLIGAVEETSSEEAAQIMATNFFAPMLLTQSALPLFRGQGSGCVVNVSSVAGTIGFPWSAMYSASKSALAVWSDALAAEVAGLGIRVTCVEPGGLRTNFAGPSLRTVAGSLAPYAGAVAATRSRYASAADAMPNDATRAATVIADLVQLDDPPRRLALGADAHVYLTDALQYRIEEYARHHDRSAHTAFTKETA
jgi:NAD(P)-dependent dehydrogenase (short-subunit alcohol dehydrogenase family)